MSMLGNFTCCNPTRIRFDEHVPDVFAKEFAPCGPVVQFVCGGSSINKIGRYVQVRVLPEPCGEPLVEAPGVMPNPMVEQMNAGARLAREHGVDFILAVGGPFIDDAKAVAVAA